MYVKKIERLLLKKCKENIHPWRSPQAAFDSVAVLFLNFIKFSHRCCYIFWFIVDICTTTDLERIDSKFMFAGDLNGVFLCGFYCVDYRLA